MIITISQCYLFTSHNRTLHDCDLLSISQLTELAFLCMLQPWPYGLVSHCMLQPSAAWPTAWQLCVNGPKSNWSLSVVIYRSAVGRSLSKICVTAFVMSVSSGFGVIEF